MARMEKILELLHKLHFYLLLIIIIIFTESNEGPLLKLLAYYLKGGII